MVRSKAIDLALAVLPDGTRDILGIWIEQIAVTDGLKGMSEALAAAFPATTLQTCLVHLMRNSLDFANWKERKPLAALDAFEQGPWGLRSRQSSPPGAAPGTQVIPFFAFPPEVRRVIYTTNALESVHARLRKILKTRGHVPNDDAATKLIWLTRRNITATCRADLEDRDESIRDSLRGSLHGADG